MKELILIQQELKAPKGQFNRFGNYRYRSCEDILEALKPILTKYGCHIVISDDIVSLPNGWVFVKATSTLTNEAGESVSSTAFARLEDAKKGMDASQITGSASSYARKYALNGLFAIDDTKDADATNKHGKDEAPAYSEQQLNEALAAVAKAATREALNEIWSHYKQTCPAILAEGSPLYAAIQAKANELKTA